ncbi:LEA type 2 family protein [Hymenobacter sp.]|uniref:LEA type 2 family protein n=1 Tax=Hymenobacter sp. TaxID=1898978 RepID=UPI00286D57D8|nr:LEA type 2 family protein [Hymenobacter sp.]
MLPHHPLKFSRLTVFGLVAVLGLSQCSVNEQAQQARALRSVDIRLLAVEQANVAGVDVTQVRESADLSAAQQAVIGAVYATGKLPLLMRVNLEMRNPNDEDVALSEMEYIALLDGKQIATGRTTDRTEVRGNGGTKLALIILESNLRSTLGAQTEVGLLTLVSGLADRDRQPMRLTLRLKPTFVTTSGRRIPPGGYANVEKEFTPRRAVDIIDRRP